MDKLLSVVGSNGGALMIVLIATAILSFFAIVFLYSLLTIVAATGDTGILAALMALLE
jgi:hypothetical protein